MEDMRKVFVFELGDEEYAVDVMNIQEITKTEDKKITDIPESSDFIVGITNVRGQVVPVISLKNRFEIAEGPEKFIILVDLNDSIAGVIVDNVKEVMDINEKRIKDAPELLKNDIHDDYVREVALLEDERMITILDLDSGFSEEEATKVSDMAQEKDSGDEVEEVTEEEIRKKTREKISG